MVRERQEAKNQDPETHDREGGAEGGKRPTMPLFIRVKQSDGQIVTFSVGVSINYGSSSSSKYSNCIVVVVVVVVVVIRWVW